MRKLLWALALTSVVWSACDDDDDGDNNTPETISGADLTFANQATYINRAEVELGLLAIDRSETAGVIDYGTMLVKDHEMALDELAEIADDYDTNLPDGLDKKHQDLKDTLMALSGYTFDSVYMANMVKGHEEAIELFERQRSNGKVSRLRDYAGKYLPHLHEHHEAADSIFSTLVTPDDLN